MERDEKEYTEASSSEEVEASRKRTRRKKNLSERRSISFPLLFVFRAFSVKARQHVRQSLSFSLLLVYTERERPLHAKMIDFSFHCVCARQRRLGIYRSHFDITFSALFADLSTYSAGSQPGRRKLFLRPKQKKKKTKTFRQ